MNSPLPLLPLAIAMVASTAATAATTSGLDAYLWRKRVVVVFAPAPDDPRLLRQRAEIDRLTGSADDRDIVLIEVGGDLAKPATFDSEALRRRLHAPPGAFRAVLIGKDGGVKLDEPGVVPATRLAAVIDAMPMRRDEMKR